MAEEIAEAVQIIRVAYDGVEIALKVGNGTIKSMQKAVELIVGMLKYEKTMGKTSMKSLVLKGGDLEVLKINADEMKRFEKMAKKYGILYSVLPSVNEKDGTKEIIFHSEAVPRINMMLQKLNFGKVTPFDDFLKNGDEEKLNSIIEFLKNQKEATPRSSEDRRVNESLDGLIEKVGLFASEKKSISVEQVKENFSINQEQAENVIKHLETIGFLDGKGEDGFHKVIMDKDAFINRIRGYQDLASRMRMIAASKDSSLSDVTISKTLVIAENDHAVKTRIPGTYGEKARYIWIKKENIMEIHNGKTILTFLDNNKDYKLYDEANRVVETQKGDTLYNHYDKVESTVRERVEKAKAQESKTKPKAPAPKRR